MDYGGLIRFINHKPQTAANMSLSNFTRIKWERARDLKKQGRYQEAERELTEALDEAPNDFLLKSSIAELYLRQDHITEAGILADSILASDPQHPQAQYIRGEIAYKQKEFGDALQYFRSAAMNDTRPYLTLRIARTLRELNRYEEALEILDSVLLKNKEDLYCLREKALILNRMKQWDEALAVYEKVYRLDPEDSFARRQMYKLKGSNRPKETVIRELEKIVSLSSEKDDAPIHELLGQKLKEAGKLQEAAAEFRVAQRLSPDNVYFLKQEGFCHYKLGDYPETCRTLGQAFKKDPDDYIVRGALKKAFQCLQDMDGFIALMEEVIETHPRNMKLLGILKKMKKGK